MKRLAAAAAPKAEASPAPSAPTSSKEPAKAEVKAAGSRSFWGEPVDSWTAGNLVGTPEQVCEKVREYEALGCAGFLPWCSDYPDTETLRLFGEKVLPELR